MITYQRANVSECSRHYSDDLGHAKNIEKPEFLKGVKIFDSPHSYSDSRSISKAFHSKHRSLLLSSWLIFEEILCSKAFICCNDVPRKPPHSCEKSCWTSLHPRSWSSHRRHRSQMGSIATRAEAVSGSNLGSYERRSLQWREGPPLSYVLEGSDDRFLSL